MPEKSYLPRFAPPPSDARLLSRLQSAAARLHDRLGALDPAALPISDYNKRYLGRYLADLQSSLEHCVYLLGLALDRHPVPPGEITLIDYGGGCGLMTLLARQSGLGRIIYNDIYDVSCRDAETLGGMLGLSADAYICGDVTAVTESPHVTGSPVHALVSSDVIEHVYDIEGFIDAICRLEGAGLSLVLASSANDLNPRTRRLTMELHRRRETEDLPKAWGHKERDTLRSYRSIRREIIREHLPSVSGEILESLVTRTRGLIRDDIIRALEAYSESGRLPEEPEHPTNTCDPYTGNWAERLMDPADLLERIQSHGFTGSVLGDYYGRYRRISKQLFTGALNLCIARAGRLGLMVAPAYVIRARRAAARTASSGEARTRAAEEKTQSEPA